MAEIDGQGVINSSTEVARGVDLFIKLKVLMTGGLVLSVSVLYCIGHVM